LEYFPLGDLGLLQLEGTGESLFVFLILDVLLVIVVNLQDSLLKPFKS